MENLTNKEKNDYLKFLSKEIVEDLRYIDNHLSQKSITTQLTLLDDLSLSELLSNLTLKNIFKLYKSLENYEAHLKQNESDEFCSLWNNHFGLNSIKEQIIELDVLRNRIVQSVSEHFKFLCTSQDKENV